MTFGTHDNLEEYKNVVCIIYKKNQLTIDQYSRTLDNNCDIHNRFIRERYVRDMRIKFTYQLSGIFRNSKTSFLFTNASISTNLFYLGILFELLSII